MSGQPFKRPPKKSLMRNLGAFFGHIAHGVTSDPHAPKPQPSQPATHPPTPTPAHQAPVQPVVYTHTLEQRVQTQQGEVLLRRTIIDEVHPTNDPPPAP